MPGTIAAKKIWTTKKKKYNTHVVNDGIPFDSNKSLNPDKWKTKDEYEIGMTI